MGQERVLYRSSIYLVVIIYSIGDYQMSLKTIELNRQSNSGKINDLQAHDSCERKDGFYSSCGQAFIRVPLK